MRHSHFKYAFWSFHVLGLYSVWVLAFKWFQHKECMVYRDIVILYVL
jgi:hypothetical protein